jgi:uroporphyrinogen-III decarboxylase
LVPGCFWSAYKITYFYIFVIKQKVFLKMNVTLSELIKKYNKGPCSVFYPGPFLPLAMIQKRGLRFNAVLQDPVAMSEAALMSYELGFESTVLPFDFNVEAEILGAAVAYHDGFDGNPIYPTITFRPVSNVNDIVIPECLETEGRMPTILNAISKIKIQAPDHGAVGAIISGPFTLASQVMEPETLFVMALKKPDEASDILARLTKFLKALKATYIAAGVDFIVIEEGGTTGISPKLFCSLVLPCLQELFSDKSLPHIISLTGGSARFIPFVLSCSPDGIGVDCDCDLEAARREIPEYVPFFAGCGDHALLAQATPEIITKMVQTCLDKGATTVGPPADIYPAAKTENIRAFTEAIRTYSVGR